MKEIEIGSKKYKIGCAAITYLDYKEKFDRNIYNDLNLALKFEYEQTKMAVDLTAENPKASQYEILNAVFEKTLDKLDEFIECLTKLCWICIYYNNKDIEDYEKWYSSISRLSLSDSWISEVLALLANCFR